MKTIPKEVQDAAKVIADACDSWTAEDIMKFPYRFGVALETAQDELKRQRRARTDSRWIRLNAAAATMREWFAKESP